MKILKAILAFAFGPFLAWINAIQQPFQNAGLSHPHWAGDADSLAIGLSAIFTLVLVAVMSAISSRYALYVVIASGIITVVALAGVFWLGDKTDAAVGQLEIDYWKEMWRRGYVAWLVVVVLTAVAALHFLIRDDD
ncbi:hypothetical protein [Pseudohalocynthiibacter sp. F2068]|jgi:hypothetical protein|uniref:hypothetical protein n=1 Tax=Pseudohalocynthiibacter sp. F2068 TaxID=2926418 RepID=UPI001FF1B436|nr:hypothetical protein [Pseudohalocynthiibacter sp. F2068]MCK0104620.1 hypothetical protein [Pseudohalocynthiibacter sp. F2068]